MKRSSRSRKTANLSESLHHRLDTYAMAASAAGVGILALAQTSEAKIVYTPANVSIHVGIVNIDLNHDGITDLGINLFHYADMYFLDASSLGRNRVWGGGFKASHLLAGVVIGPNQEKFAKGNLHCASSLATQPCKVMEIFYDSSGHPTSRGLWAKHKNGYLGLKFYIQGKVHFGWARLQRAKLGKDWVLTGYAYETVVRKPIVTGRKKGPAEINSVSQTTPVSHRAPDLQPITLGMLALGSPGLSIWRRGEASLDAQ